MADSISRDRLILTVIGGFAGLAAYLLVEVLPDHIDNERMLLFIAASTGAFFAAFIGASGPLTFPRAALAGLIAGVPASVLLTWSSLRFENVEDMLETGHMPLAYILIVSISLPFLIAAQREGEGWRNYPALFQHAWKIVVRYAAAWLFVALFWAVVFLSDALFGLVGLDIIEELLEIEWVPFVLTGAVLGIGMAVVVELSDYVSPFLILRLLRLLLPVVLLVTAVFLVALPFQGLSNLFGGLSAAATLMAMALGNATLITSGLDQTDADAAHSRFMQGVMQTLSLTMPVLAGLAIYAIALRVADYGWSPTRIAAASASGVVMAYGLFYAIAVILRTGWMDRIRGANMYIALGVIALSALWLSPVLDAQRISAMHQLARFEGGKVSAEDLDLWALRDEMGRAGERVIETLKEVDHPEVEILQARIERLEQSSGRYEFEHEDDQIGIETVRAEFIGMLQLIPSDATLPEGLFDEIGRSDLTRWLEACARSTPKGRSGCGLLLADLLPADAGNEALLVLQSSQGLAQVIIFEPNRDPKRSFNQPLFVSGSGSSTFDAGFLDRLIDGAYSVGPARINHLRVRDSELVISP